MPNFFQIATLSSDLTLHKVEIVNLSKKDVCTLFDSQANTEKKLLIDRYNKIIKKQNITTKEEKEIQLFAGYDVNIKCVCVNSEYGKGEFSNWHASFEASFDSIRHGNTGPNLASTLKLQKGETVYVVWANWGSGDSFGFADSKYTEPLAIFTDEYKATAFKEWVLSQSTKNNQDCAYTKVYTDGEQIIYVNLAWAGYFSQLSAINCSKTTIK